MCWWFFKGDSISLNHCSNNTQGDDDIDCCGDYIETDCVSAASILSVLSARGMHRHETVNARDVFSDMNGGIDAEVAANHLPLPDGIVPNLHYPWITTSVLNNPCYILQKTAADVRSVPDSGPHHTKHDSSKSTDARRTRGVSDFCRPTELPHPESSSTGSLVIYCTHRDCSQRKVKLLGHFLELPSIQSFTSCSLFSL